MSIVVIFVVMVMMIMLVSMMVIMLLMIVNNIVEVFLIFFADNWHTLLQSSTSKCHPFLVFIVAVLYFCITQVSHFPTGECKKRVFEQCFPLIIAHLEGFQLNITCCFRSPFSCYKFSIFIVFLNMTVYLSLMYSCIKDMSYCFKGMQCVWAMLFSSSLTADPAESRAHAPRSLFSCYIFRICIFLQKLIQFGGYSLPLVNQYTALHAALS